MELLTGPSPKQPELFPQDTEILNENQDDTKDMKPTRRWFRVRGPISAIKATLMDLKWNLKPIHWQDPEGYDWKLDMEQFPSIEETFKDFDQFNLLATVASSLEASLWQQASSFDYGAGLALGTDL